MTSVNIFGSCVSRETFNSYIGSKYEIKEYIFGQAPFFNREKIDEYYWIEENQSKLPTSFQRRSLCTLFNGITFDRLMNRKGDWIVLDNYYYNDAIIQVSFDDKKQLLQIPDHPLIKNDLIRITNCDERFKNIKVEKIMALPNFSMASSDIIHFLNTYYPGRVIIIDAKFCRYSMDGNGVITEKKYPGQQNEFVRSMACQKIVEECKATYITPPFDCISDYYRHGDSPVHYISEIYDYYKETIDSIIEKKGDIDSIKIKYQTKIGKILNGQLLSSHNTAERIRNLIRKKDIRKANMLLERLNHQKDVLCDVFTSLFIMKGFINRDITVAKSLLDSVPYEVDNEWIVALRIDLDFIINDEKSIIEAN